MFRDGHHSISGIPDALSLASYGRAVRAAHALADLMKKSRPHLYERVDELQMKIARCQNTLDEAKGRQQRFVAGLDDHPANANTPPCLSPEILAALKELEETTQALLDLRHKGQMAR